MHKTLIKLLTKIRDWLTDTIENYEAISKLEEKIDNKIAGAIERDKNNG